MSVFRNFMVISRYEFMFGGVFFLLSVSFLGSGSWVRLKSKFILVVLGVIVWYLSHMIGSKVNCLADYELDRKYKVHLADAVDFLGRKTIWGVIIVESFLALFFTLVMVFLVGKPILVVLWVFGWLVTMGYSLEPLRLKRRGVLNPLSLILVLYTLPIAFGYIALSDSVNLLIVKLLIAVGLQMFSLILLNEVEDIPEDRDQNIRTPCVRYGLWPVVPIAAVIYIAGVVMTIIYFFRIIQADTVRWGFLIVAGLVQLIVIRDLFSLTVIAWKQKLIPDESQIYLDKTRTLGKRNAFHFAVLGLTFGIGSVLTLNFI